MNSYIAAMRKYAVFQGWASRSEFWYFTLFFVLISFMAVIIDTAVDTEHRGLALLFVIVYVAHLLPCLAVAIRRLHDIGRSGWWWLIALTGIGSIVLLVFHCQRGTPGQPFWSRPS
jgi:uncharacterized membrane protein YhaH (DUF805 family)